MSERKPGAIVGGKYRIVRFLAAGGMGAVYEAEHLLVGRRCALKFLHARFTERRDLLARFEQEARTAGTLARENVAGAFDIGVSDEGCPYIVLEYLEGESLDRLMKRSGGVPRARAVDLIVQACRGVQAAHVAGIIHRDLKPQNMFVCRRDDGTDLLKVLDFGVAKLQSAAIDCSTTATGTVMGTPEYMSPEQARGDKLIDCRADVYALGAVLYELLSGKKPHPGDSPNALLHHVATQPALPLDQDGIAPELAAIVQAAVARAPEDRPASALALGKALEPWARSRAWPIHEPDAPVDSTSALSPTQLAPAVVAPGVALPSAAPNRRTLRSSSRPVQWGVASLVFGVFAGMLIAFGVGTDDSRLIHPPRDEATAISGLLAASPTLGEQSVPTAPTALASAVPPTPFVQPTHSKISGGSAPRAGVSSTPKRPVIEVPGLDPDPL